MVAKMTARVATNNDTVHTALSMWHLAGIAREYNRSRDHMDEAGIEKVVALLPYGSCPVPGVATAGQPDAQAWGALARAGFKSVIDLREPDEPRGHDEPGEIALAGLAYLALPVNHDTLGDRQFDAVRSFVGDPAHRPVLVHCATANRVGALLLPYFALDEHMAVEEAHRLAVEVGMRSPDYSQLALDYVRRHSPTDG
ncbi:MAG: hypothetical protein ACHQRL_04725 [Gemmatimonadales bacterium]